MSKPEIGTELLLPGKIPAEKHNENLTPIRIKNGFTKGSYDTVSITESYASTLYTVADVEELRRAYRNVISFLENHCDSGFLGFECAHALLARLEGKGGK